MNNILSSFTLYEILRIILPGFYFMTNIAIYCVNTVSFHNQTIPEVYQAIIFITLSILVGGVIYSFDLPRIYKPFLRALPTNRIRRRFNLDNAQIREMDLENLYNQFYYSLAGDSKMKTEIHSGFYHLFINMFFTSFFLAVLFYCILPYHPILTLNLSKANVVIYVICFIGAIITYIQRLRRSFRRNFSEFLESL